MPIEPGTIAQVLILTLGIYVLLSFLRTTRGNGVVRWVSVTILVFVGLLYLLAENNKWLELQIVIRNVATVLAVILAIIFQPELRRGMINLGDHQILGRFLGKQLNVVLSEVASAVVAMAKKKQGALIAFERQTPLDAYIEKGVKVDAEVTRLILDSIFHHGSALHDGGVIIRENRIEAAACIFPLTENEELSKSTGTRHRAALGLSEETDAVTVMVSEETGFISICKAGKLERRIARAELEQILGERIGHDKGESERSGAWASAGLWIRDAFTKHLGQKAMALLLAIAAFMLAYKDVHETKVFDLTLEVAFATESGAEPKPEKLVILLPNKTVSLAAGQANRKYRVSVEGPRADVESLSDRLGGVYVVEEFEEDSALLLPIEGVSWGGSSFLENLDMEWVSATPRLSIQSFERHDVELRQEHIKVDSTSLDPFYEPRKGGVTFTRGEVTISGPKEAIARIKSGELAFELEPIVLKREDRQLLHPIALPTRLLDMQLQLVGIVHASLPIVPTEFLIGTLESEVSLQSFDPHGGDPAELYERPSREVPLTIFARGVLPREDAGTASDPRNRQFIQRYVEDNIRCFIDVGKLEGTGSREGVVETGGIEDWRSFLRDAFKVEGFDEDAKVWVELVEEDRTILLKPIEPPQDDAEQGNGEDTQ